MTLSTHNPTKRQAVNLFKVQRSRFNVDELKRVINFFKYFEINIEL